MSKRVTSADVEAILEGACGEGNLKLNRKEFSYSEDSSKNEKFMVSLLEHAAEQRGFSKDLVNHLAGKSFPDVHLKGSSIGIELKGSRKGGTITGNSIFAGSMVENLNKVYLFYWIDDRKPRLGFRDYFDCVFDAKVTHSPRFALQVDLPVEDSMFGNRSDQLGFVAADWLSGDKKYVEGILSEIRRRALARDEIPWWVQSETGEGLAFQADSGEGFGGIRQLSNLEPAERYSLYKTLFLGFPEILFGGSAAHANAIGWAISRKSVIVGRDAFSAGGQKEVDLGGRIGVVKLPAVVQRCASALERNVLVSLADLSEIVGFKVTSKAVIGRFESKLRGSDRLSYLYEYLHSSKRRTVTIGQFSDAVADFLVEQLESTSIR